jgi:hypothetical protein
MAKARRNKTDAPNPIDSADDSSITTGAGATGDVARGGYSSEQIAARAYELYLARGAGDGQDFADWIAAERELATRASDPDEHRLQPAAGERSE